MPRAKKHTPEQIIGKLRKAEQMQAQGKTIAEVCKAIGVTDQTFFRWRLKYGGMGEQEARRLKELETENARLKKIVAEQLLDIDMLKELQRGKW